MMVSFQPPFKEHRFKTRKGYTSLSMQSSIKKNKKKRVRENDKNFKIQ